MEKKVIGGGNKWIKFEINGDGECDWSVCNCLIESDIEISNVFNGNCDWIVDKKYEEIESLIDEVDDVNEEERELWNEFINELRECEESEWMYVVKMWSEDGSGWNVGVLMVSMIN